MWMPAPAALGSAPRSSRLPCRSKRSAAMPVISRWLGESCAQPEPLPATLMNDLSRNPWERKPFSGGRLFMEFTMKKTVLILAASLLSTAAFAQDTTTTIKKEEGILGSQTTIERKTEPSTTSSTSVTTSTGSVGCTTETKQKTDEFGDTTTKKKTEC